MKEMKNIYNVPEGYFERLEKRLEAIPSQQHVETAAPAVTVPLWVKVRPYIALAACMLMAFFVGNFFLGKNQAPASSEIGLQDYYMADLIPVTNPYAIYDDAPVELYTPESSSEEDVVQYLISSGTSVDYIAYLLNQ